MYNKYPRFIILFFACFGLFSSFANANDENRLQQLSLEQMETLAEEFIPLQGEIEKNVRHLSSNPTALKLEAIGKSALQASSIDTQSYQSKFLFCMGANLAIIFVIKGSECWDTDGKSYFMAGLNYSSNSIRSSARGTVMVDFGTAEHQISGSYFNAEGELSTPPVGAHLGILVGYEKKAGAKFIFYGGVSVGGGIPGIEGGYLYATRTPILDLDLR